MASLTRLVRGLWRDWLFTSVVVVIIASAVAINGSVFAAVTAILLRPLPIADPHELVVGWGTDPARALTLVELSYQNVSDWAARARTLSRAGAMGSSTWPETFVGNGPPRRLWSAGVSGTFFATLGVTAALGRTLGPQDDVPNGPPVAVISHRLWQSQFGGAATVVGKTLRLVDGDRVIVGVMPAGMELPRGTDLWIPVVPVLTKGDTTQRNLRNVGVLWLVGRLRPGIALDAARRELDDLAARAEREDGTPRFGTATVLTPLPDVLFGPVRTALWVAAGAVVLLALSAAANVAMLLLARALACRSADAICLALGARPRMLTRARVVEVLLLGIAGGIVGALLSWGMTRVLVALAPPDLFRLESVHTDWRVIATTWLVSLAVLTATAATVATVAAQNTPMALRDDDTRQTSGRGARRLRGVLVILQVGCAYLLLVVAWLLARSVIVLDRIDVGFEPRQAAVLKLEPSAHAESNAWMDLLLTRLSHRPDLIAGALYLRPLALGAIGQEVGVRLHGQAEGSSDVRANPALNYQIATEHTFRALGVSTRRGRTFRASDDQRATRVAVVSESTARRLWPTADAVGQRLEIRGMPPDDPGQRWRTVIGVVSDVRYRGVRDVRLDVYDTALQVPTPATDVVVRTSGDPLAAAAAIAATARELDPDVLIDGVTTLEAIVERATAPWTFAMTLLMVFAAAAVLIAAGGLVAIVTLETRRTAREFAIRAALGARPGQLVAMVLRRALYRVVTGAAAGTLGALVAAPYLRPLLVEVSPFDPRVFLASAGALIGLGVVAAWLPAMRAARAQPASLLR